MTFDTPTPEDPTPAETPPSPATEILPDTTRAREGPALTITVQSWSTPLVGLVMLALGLLLGYVGRPLVTDRLASFQPTATAQPTPAAMAGPPPQLNGREELMQYLASQTRHFLGNPDAPVVMFEFSDFQ